MSIKSFQTHSAAFDDKTIKLDDSTTLESVLKEYNKKEKEVTITKLVGISASSEIHKGFGYAFRNMHFLNLVV